MSKYKYWWICLILLVAGCNNVSIRDHSSSNEPPGVIESGSGNLYFVSLFGEKYLTQGGFLKGSGDYIETNLWSYTSLSRLLVVEGHYLNGLQTGNWNFILNNGTVASSKWEVYNNGVTPCSFSIPLKYEELNVDSFSLKLRSITDTLGKIGIQVQIRDTFLNEEGSAKIGLRSDTELHEQGYTFTNKKREIEKDKNKYHFYEYFLKDSTNKESRVYYFFGNTPNKKHFVLFTLFHQGPREDLVQIICSLIAESLYINSERFYYPYEFSKE